MEESAFKEACTKVKMLLFDCDGVLTDGRIVLGSNGSELKFFSTKDGMGISLWRKAGFLCGCITGRSSDALQKRAQELGFEELHQGVSDKRAVLEEIMVRRGLQRQEIAFIGDDLNDLCLLHQVGVFFVPLDGHSEAVWRADWVLTKNGGEGAVREAIDLLLNSKNLMEKIITSMIA